MLIASFKPYIAPVATGISLVVGVYMWTDARFDSLQEEMHRIESRVVMLLDHQETRLVQVTSDVIIAIDRHEEFVSAEHQRGSAHLSGMLMNIGHSLGYAERVAHEEER